MIPGVLYTACGSIGAWVITIVDELNHEYFI